MINPSTEQEHSGQACVTSLQKFVVRPAGRARSQLRGSPETAASRSEMPYNVRVGWERPTVSI